MEEEEASPLAKAGDKTDGAKTAFDKIDDDRKRKSCLIYIDFIGSIVLYKEGMNHLPDHSQLKTKRASEVVIPVQSRMVTLDILCR